MYISSFLSHKIKQSIHVTTFMLFLSTSSTVVWYWASRAGYSQGIFRVISLTSFHLVCLQWLQKGYSPTPNLMLWQLSRWITTLRIYTLIRPFPALPLSLPRFITKTIICTMQCTTTNPTTNNTITTTCSETHYLISKN